MTPEHGVRGGRAGHQSAVPAVEDRRRLRVPRRGARPREGRRHDL